MNIYNFKYRGHYPNYHYIRLFFKKWKYGEEVPLPEGYVMPQVEYWEKQGEKSKEIEVSLRDTPFLIQRCKNSASSYLAKLIEAQNGNQEAEKEIGLLVKEYWEKKALHYQQAIIIEDEYTIPSCTTKNYDSLIVGDKGQRLIELTQKGYPVPDFCIVSSKHLQLNADEQLHNLKISIKNLEQMTGQIFGCSENPLVFAMRYALPNYLPGLMPTYLNVGITKISYKGLKKLYGKRVAGRAYINNLKTIYQCLYPHVEELENKLLSANMAEIKQSIDFLIEGIKKLDEQLLIDPLYQVLFFMKEAKKFYIKNQDLLNTFLRDRMAHPSVILHKMVWTILDNDSYPGVLYSRHSRTGMGIQIESLRNIFGEDIMTGIMNSDDLEFFDKKEIKEKFPAVYHFVPLLSQLENYYKSPVTIEFAAESNRHAHLFAVLQLNASELTGRATLISSVDLYNKGIITKKEVQDLVHPYHLRQIFSDSIDDQCLQKLTFFSKGFSILPRSAVSAKAYFSATKALEAKKRGEHVCFCKKSFVPTDTIVLSELDAIISLNPAAIHVVTACKSYGVPAFLNLEQYGVSMNNDTLYNADGVKINEGDWVTISSKQKIIYLGQATYTPARFQRYIDGEKLEMSSKEEKVFVSLDKIYKSYQKIVQSFDYNEIVYLNDLHKFIRNNFNAKPEKTQDFINVWFKSNIEYYISQILKSKLGTHQEQHRLYEMLNLEHQVAFFKGVIKKCLKENLYGFNAGSFMLGRFICIPHLIAFWKEFTSKEIAFMLNESVLFEKYIKVLYDVGERKINRARDRILNEGLGEIELNKINAKVFMPLKLASQNWKEIENHIQYNYDKETINFAKMLQKPYGYFYSYNVEWSLNQLKAICQKENLSLPEEDAI